MKAKLPFGISFRVALFGRKLTKVLTILLCAFSFALFALSSTGYMYDRVDFLTRSLLTTQKTHTPAILFSHFDFYDQERGIPSEQIPYIEQETGLDFVFTFDFNTISEYLGESFYYENNPDAFSVDEVLSGTAAAYEDCRFQLMAGRYPEAYDEIALPIYRFDHFHELGYTSYKQNWVYFKNGKPEVDLPLVDEKEGYYYIYKDHEGAELSVPIDYTGYQYVDMGPTLLEKIETYEDLWGKEVYFQGDPETGSLGLENIYTLKIVGLVDCTQAKVNISENRNFILHSKAWREVFWPSLKEGVEYLAAGPTDDYDLARSCVEVTLSMIENYEKEHPEAVAAQGTVGVEPIHTFINHAPMSSVRFWDASNTVTTAGTGGGLLFGIIAVLLCWHLMTSTLALQRIKIGILRSMGAGEADVIRIILIEALIVAVGGFLLGLIFTLAGYYWVLYPLFYIKIYGVCPLVLNGWNILFLAGLSFIVPFLCTIVPIKKFLKQSIVDNISGNISKG